MMMSRLHFEGEGVTVPSAAVASNANLMVTVSDDKSSPSVIIIIMCHL